MRFAAVVGATVVVGLAILGCSRSTSPTKPVKSPLAILSIDSAVVTLGGSVGVRLSLQRTDPDSRELDSLGGFELLLGYDSRAIRLEEPITADSAISRWEYFTYRVYGPAPEDSTGLATVRIIAQRDINNGVSPDPAQYRPDGALATLNFTAFSNPKFIGTTAAVGFLVRDCHDNVLIPEKDPTHLYSPDTSITGPGVQRSSSASQCSQNVRISPVIGLRDGGIRVGRYPLLLRGDIDLDGVPFQWNDLIIFGGYFLEGFSTWAPAVASLQIAATDCNGDGEPLTVADLDFGFRVLTWGVSPLDTLRSPYTDTVLLIPRRTEGGWTISTRSTAPVDVLWLQVEDPSQQHFIVRYLGNQELVGAGYNQIEGTLRILVNGFSYKSIFDTAAADRLEILTQSPAPLNIVAAQASVFPGTPMVVRSVRPIGQTNQIVTVGRKMY